MFLEGKTLELMIAAVVALVVVGPKDLPILLRRLGQFMGRMRGMAAEFRASFDEMARQSELDELRKEVQALRHGQLAEIAGQTPEMTRTLDDIHQGLTDAGVQLHPPMSYQFSQETAPPPPEPASGVPAPKPKPRAKKTVAKAASASSGAAKAAPTKPAAKPRTRKGGSAS
ncbi:Sec-independent protein translocase protein TatB [Phenylobacterium sp.]|uniref:Sec-independent protein translocase protein TatB n=1 Tax=Phenylobacterium sp. TaxID=1871053 RepID=UPI002622163A|nr:Sec-independent protein translocase protein TatB [Phenylobacterium sp.]